MDQARQFQGHPSLYWPVSSTQEIVFRRFSGGYVVCVTDEMGRQLTPAPSDAVKFFRRKVTRLINSKGYENFSAQCSPNPAHRLNYIGIMCGRDEALERAYNNLQRCMLEAHRNGRYFINPAGIAWPFDEGDRVFHPDEFGLAIPPISMRSVEE